MTTEQKNSVLTAKIIYILLIVSSIIGLTGIIGLIMAYIYKDGSADWLKTHYRFQIRTFWIGLLYTTLGVLTVGINLGLFILLFTFIWLIIRCTKGLKQLDHGQPVTNLESWLFT